MTYDNFYSVSNIPNGKRKPKTVGEFTLYEACKELESLAIAGKAGPATVVTEWRDRPVACYSEWHKTIRPMFTANDQERTAPGFDYPTA